jgi:Cu+-exporting ATPase
MTCASCAASVSKLLQRRGLKEVSVNASNGAVSFIAPEDLQLPVVFDAIDGLGYKAVRPGEGGDIGIHAGHEHGKESLADRLLLPCILLTVPLLAHMALSWPLLHHPLFQLALSTPVFIAGWVIFGRSAVNSLRHGLPNMNVLIMLGATAAYGYSLQSLIARGGHAHQFMFFETAASIITLVMVGNWLEHRTVKQTTKSIDALARLQPPMARLVQVDSIGKETTLEVEAKYVRTDDLVRVSEGDAMPVDGLLERGSLQVDERMITGEALPAAKAEGDAVVGGTIVAQGSALVRATTVGAASTLSRIVRLVQEAQAAKPPLQKLADKIAGIFVPAVLGISALTLLINWFWVDLLFAEAMSRAIAVLVISCPCAMGLATPAAVAVGLGRAARSGILVKGGDTLERMKTIRTVVFDKTGTLTTGELRVSDTVLNGLDEQQFKSLVVALEQHSSHPIARSLVQQWGNSSAIDLQEVREHKGKGLEGRIGGSLWQIGSWNWLNPVEAPEGFDLYLLQDRQFRGALRLEDDLRADAAATVAALKARGYSTVLLSGDRDEKCRAVAGQVGIGIVHAEKSPEAKAAVLDELLKQGGVAMVGDGINDAPSLAKATVGISLSEASQVAVQSANVILSSNRLSALPKAMQLGIYTERTIRTNLFWAFLYNVIAIPIAAAGYLSPTWGAGVMALSDVVLALNSLYLGVRRID